MQLFEFLCRVTIRSSINAELTQPVSLQNYKYPSTVRKRPGGLSLTIDILLMVGDVSPDVQGNVLNSPIS
jgi:hypothetical protein